MSNYYVGELRLVSFNYAPKNWAQCNGQLIPISQNQALFSLLGTTYGGNGIQNFGLPNLQGRTPISFGTNTSGSYNQGEVGGVESVTLTTSSVPTHTHIANAVTSNANAVSPGGAYLAATPNIPVYGGAGNLAGMNPAVVGNYGGSQPHENRQPYLVMNWVIALYGIFPSRN